MTLTVDSRAPGAQPSILVEDGLHAVWAAQPLVEAGFVLQSCPFAEVPRRLASGRHNALVLGRYYLPRKTRGEADAFLAEIEGALRDFLAAGGGVFVCLPVVREETAQRLLAPYGAQFLKARIVQEDRVASADGQDCAYTPALKAPGGAAGGFWYPLHLGHAMATRPVRTEAGRGWVVAAAGSTASRTEPLAQDGYGLPGAAVDGFSASVPIVAARHVGAGRLAVCGIPAGYHLYAPHNYHPARRLLAEGFDGRPSELLAFLTGLLGWLATPTDPGCRLGGAATDPGTLRPQVPRFPDDPPLRWAARTFPPDDPAPRTGLIGARTRRSSGAGTVADYAARARAAGHGFIVFLEEFAALTAASWQALKEECEAHTSDDFFAVPGFTLEDGVGSRWFQYGYEIDLPLPDLLSADGKRLSARAGDNPRNNRVESPHFAYIFGEMKLRGRRGCYLHGASPKGIVQNRCADSIALVTWEAGRVVEDVRADYPMLLDKGLRLHPVALTFLDAPADVDRALASGWRNTIIEPYAAIPDRVLRKHMAPELELWTMFEEAVFRGPRYRFDCWQYGLPFQSITDGPLIRAWTVSVSDRDPEWRAPDNEIPPTADGFRVDVCQFRLRLRVESEVGLAEVVLHDGIRPLRRWRAGGARTWEQELDLVHHQQMHLFVEARDLNGGAALSGDYLTYRRDWCEFYCADRNNPLAIGMEKGPAGDAYGWSGGEYLCYNNLQWGGTSPVIGKWWFSGDSIYPVPRDPLRDFLAPYDGGVGPAGAGLHIKVELPKQEPPERGLMLVSSQDMVSADAAICSFVCDRGYDPEAPYFVGGEQGFGLYGMHPTRYVEVTRHAITFRPSPGALTAKVYDYVIRCKQPVVAGGAIPVGWFDAGSLRLLHRADGSTADLDALIRDGGARWERDDTVSVWTSGARPALFVNDGVPLWLAPDPARKGCLRVGLDAGALAAAGRETRVRILALGGTHEHTNPGLVARLRATMGFAGPPGYAVALREGTIRSQRLVFELEASAAGAAVFTIPRCELPLALPLAVHGLNENWSTVLYDRPRRRWRPLGLWRGAAYVSLDTASQAWDIAMGHPVVCDRPAVAVSLAQVGERDWRLEAHNPGDQAVDCTLVPAAWFDPLDWAGQRLTLPPGVSEVVRLSVRDG
jgi:hypothetical protein